MDVLNSFMKITKGTIINNKEHFGLKFLKKKIYEELFSTDENVIREWYQKLKRYCILTKFRRFFKSIRVLGEGNFAKVFLVERISDKKRFAVKVFNKRLIMSDKNEV